jgi:hypothetical protein
MLVMPLVYVSKPVPERTLALEPVLLKALHGVSAAGNYIPKKAAY